MGHWLFQEDEREIKLRRKVEKKEKQTRNG